MIWFFVIVGGLLAALGLLYWRWRRGVDAQIAEGAAIEWAQLEKHEPEFLEGLSREEFNEVYARVHTPRFPGYALAAFATFLISLPVSFVLLAGALWGLQSIGAIPEPVEVADRLLLEGDQVRFFKSAPPEAALYYIEDLSGFYYFFGIIVIWLLIVAFYMRRYHGRRPGYLRDEIIRSRQKGD